MFTVASLLTAQQSVDVGVVPPFGYSRRCGVWDVTFSRKLFWVSQFLAISPLPVFDALYPFPRHLCPCVCVTLLLFLMANWSAPEGS